MIVPFICHVCETPLGKIDTETIHLPYTPDQFLPIAPGANPPYPAILSDWTMWWCPQCNNRPMLADRVRTSEGWVDVAAFDSRHIGSSFDEYLQGEQRGKPVELEPEDFVVETHDTTINVPMTEEQKKNATILGFTCTKCGKVCKNKIGLMGHMRSHK